MKLHPNEVVFCNHIDSDTILVDGEKMLTYAAMAKELGLAYRDALAAQLIRQGTKLTDVIV
jgi:hypothetical protein